MKKRIWQWTLRPLPAFGSSRSITTRDRCQRHHGDHQLVTGRADFLIIDERSGRQVAEQLGVRCVGLVGVLLMAKSAGYISNLKIVLDRLEKVAGFYLSQNVKAKALAAAGE